MDSTDTRSRSIPRRVLLAGLAASVTVVAACTSSPQGSGSTSGPSHSGTPSASVTGGGSAAADLLPDAIKKSGVIRVAATFGYPPNQFYGADNTTPIGISVDLANALGKVLGVHFEFTNVQFDSIIPGLLANRYDTIIGAMAVTPPRLKQFAMVVYQNTGGGIVVAGGNPRHINGVEDLCGLKVAMLKGAHFIEQLQQISDSKCVQAGKPAVQMDIYDGSADTYQAVAAHRADATYTSYDVARYTAQKSGGSLGFVDQLYPDNPYGAVFTKANLPLAKAVQAALSEIIADGTYRQVLDKWGAGREAVTSAELEPTP